MSSHTAAVQALKSLPLFRHTSLRLLADLVDLTEDGDPDDTTVTEVNAALVAVIDGVVDVHVPHNGDPRAARRRLTSGDSVVTDATSLANRPVRLRSLTPGKSRVLRLTQESLAERVHASPALLRSLEASDVEALIGTAAQREDYWGPRTHLMWITAEPGFEVPLEALTFLLAGAVARQFNEHAAVAVLHDDTIDLSVVDPDLFIDEPMLDEPHTLEKVVAALGLRGIPFAHVLVVHPERPDVLPASIAARQFHRVVALMRRVPDRPPDFAIAQLRAELCPPETDRQPYFSSFVPTVFLPRPAHERTVELVTERLRIDDHDPLDDPSAAADMTHGQRLRRDQCRLRVDLGEVARRWESHAAPMVALPALLADATLAASMERWARAVTNRRVGLALSGGGASIYRLLPLLDRLTVANVPIDVVSGVSGGALLGAYYAKKGFAGAKLCAERGPSFQLRVLLSLLDVRPFQRLIDADLEHATLDDLEVTFVPLTTARHADVPPEAHAVVAGTLGHAVRASGALPVLFAPTEQNGVRYADGVTSALIPARALARFGADMAIACNCIPGPQRRNPFSSWPLGDFLYDYTPAGRFIDLWVATSSLVQRVSRDATEDAHVFIEVSNARTPLVESFYFYDAESIIAEAERDHELEKGARLCASEWEEFARGSTR